MPHESFKGNMFLGNLSCFCWNRRKVVGHKQQKKVFCLFCFLFFRHDNQTGRWLTPFKATWDSKNECGFVVGNMKYPRKVRMMKLQCMWCDVLCWVQAVVGLVTVVWLRCAVDHVV